MTCAWAIGWLAFVEVPRILYRPLCQPGFRTSLLPSTGYGWCNAALCFFFASSLTVFLIGEGSEQGQHCDWTGLEDWTDR